MNDDQQFENRLRKALESMADAAPEPHPFPDSLLISDSDEPAPHQPSAADHGLNRPLTVAAVFLAASIAAGVWASRTTNNQITADSGVTVQHELVRYSQSFDLTCPEGEPDITGEFNTMEIESWGSQDLGLWRQVVRYPDGTQREMIATDNPWAPADLYKGGTTKGREIACPGLGIIHHEPSKYLWFDLNPMAKPPTTTQPEESTNHIRFSLGELVDESAIGPDGQPVQRWRYAVDNDFVYAAGEAAFHQVYEWLIDPTTGHIVQQSSSSVYEGMGEIQWISELVARDTTTGGDELFNTDGLTLVP